MSSAALQPGLRTIPKTPAELVMQRETRVTFGPVSHTLFGEPLAPTTWQVLEDEFLLRGEGHHYFHYPMGRGIIVERGADADVSEESLCLNASVAAALGACGLPMFCDDTLVLDLSDPDRIICLPGHKRMKLKPDALELSGAEREERVSQTVDKHYAIPAAGSVGVALPLTRLVFLE